MHTLLRLLAIPVALIALPFFKLTGYTTHSQGRPH
jgi:hypothetical protein